MGLVIVVLRPVFCPSVQYLSFFGEKVFHATVFKKKKKNVCSCSSPSRKFCVSLFLALSFFVFAISDVFPYYCCCFFPWQGKVKNWWNFYCKQVQTLLQSIQNVAPTSIMPLNTACHNRSGHLLRLALTSTSRSS